jgi:hypothetical protein
MKYSRIAIARFVIGAALFCCALPSIAEVGVRLSGSPGDEQVGSIYIVVGITDGSDPFSLSWSRYSGSNENIVVLNEQGYTNGDGRPSMAFQLSTQTPIVVWSRNSPTGFDVVMSRFENQTWTEPIVLAGGPDDALDPVVSIDPTDGAMHLLYWVAGQTAQVMHRQAAADLTVWSDPIVVSQPGVPSLRPSATFHAGSLVVTYELHGGGLGQVPRQIAVATRQQGQFTTDIIANTYHAPENRPEAHSDGQKLWIDWIDGENTMTWSDQAESSPWSTVQAEPFDGVEERDFHVRGRIKAVIREQ